MARMATTVWFWKFAFVLVVGLHSAVVLGNLAALCVLLFLAPWYVALPLCSFLVFLTTSRSRCVLTDLENVARRRLDRRPIGGFLGHYVLGAIFGRRRRPERKVEDVQLAQGTVEVLGRVSGGP